MASASASATSAGPSTRRQPEHLGHHPATWSLVAAPYPTRLSFTSLAVYWTTSQPASAATSSASPLAWPTDMAVLAFTWKKTRSTTTACGRNSCTSARSSVCRINSRSASGASGSVSMTPAACARSAELPSARATSP